LIDHKNWSTAYHLLLSRYLALLFRPWRWRRYAPPKHRLVFNGLHGVISLKIVLLETVKLTSFLNIILKEHARKKIFVKFNCVKWRQSPHVPGEI
jgi:hypothetical protein